MNTSLNIKEPFSFKKSKEYVKRLLHKSLPDHINFHDWSHTNEVIKEAEKIGDKIGLSKEEVKEIKLAALFHETGFIKTDEGHEDASAEIAKEYLEGTDYPEAKISKITLLIKATKDEVIPQTIQEKILKDASFAYLGKKKFDKKLRNLLIEKRQTENEKLVEIDWNQTNLEFLNSHIFHTKVARKLYGERKEKNLLKLRDRVKKLEIENSISENKAARMIFKTALRNHIDLTSIADKKANIMLTITALILSLGIPLFSTYLIDKNNLLIPGIIFLATCGVTMILATLATRPVHTDGKTDLDKIFSGKTNLFFFGNFYKLKLSDYQSAIDNILSDRKTLDRSIMNDLFYLGQALGEKFRMLRICYTVFAGGLIITFIAFIIAHFLK